MVYVINDILSSGRFGKPNGVRKTIAAAVEASSAAPVEKPASQPKVRILYPFI